MKWGTLSPPPSSIMAATKSSIISSFAWIYCPTAGTVELCTSLSSHIPLLSPAADFGPLGVLQRGATCSSFLYHQFTRKDSFRGYIPVGTETSGISFIKIWHSTVSTTGNTAPVLHFLWCSFKRCARKHLVTKNSDRNLIFLQPSKDVWVQIIRCPQVGVCEGAHLFPLAEQRLKWK